MQDSQTNGASLVLTTSTESYSLKQYFIIYMKEIRKLKDKTVTNYLDAIRYISKYLVEKDVIHESLYEVTDYESLTAILGCLKNDSYFSALDKRGKQMYSSGMKNYIRFSQGNYLNPENVILLDCQVPKTMARRTEVISRKRQPIIKLQSLESASYLCEIDRSHTTFIAANTGKQYMEAHHIISLHRQDQFSAGLDVHANVMCLCPICHRLLHYGRSRDKTNYLEMIYHSRKNRLANCGIRLSEQEFLEVCT